MYIGFLKQSNLSEYIPSINRLISIVIIPFIVSTQCFAAYCDHNADKIIKLYNLQPSVPEGGYYALTYKLDDPNSDVPKATAIYYMLKGEDVSLLHKLSSDIVYHFYTGNPVTMVVLKKDGSGEKITLGADVLHDQITQVVVPKGAWIGTYVNNRGCYALMGTTMTPGFDPNGYELGNRSELIKQYPEFQDEIIKLTTN